MKTKDIDVDIVYCMKHLHFGSGESPSPFFIPSKIIISSDDINNTNSLTFLYFNRESDEELLLNGASISLGKISKKIQQIRCQPLLPLTDVLKLVEKSDLKMKEIIIFVMKNFVLNSTRTSPSSNPKSQYNA